MRRGLRVPPGLRPALAALLLPGVVPAPLPAAGPGREPPATPGPVPHGVHARYSRYLIDPLFTHHAILEDELRVNLFLDARRRGGDRLRTSLEVAYAFSDAVGAEVFLALAGTGFPGAGGYGLGDAEIQPLKWSFLRREELVATAVLGATLPLGDDDRGLGGGAWALEPHLFVDLVLHRVAVQTNLVYGFVEGGEQELEFSLSLARIGYFGAADAVGPTLELMGALATRGEGAGSWESLGIAPGLKLQLGGWHFGTGVRVPLVEGDDSRRLLVATGGYHVSF